MPTTATASTAPAAFADVHTAAPTADMLAAAPDVTAAILFRLLLPLLLLSLLFDVHDVATSDAVTPVDDIPDAAFLNMPPSDGVPAVAVSTVIAMADIAMAGIDMAAATLDDVAPSDVSPA